MLHKTRLSISNCQNSDNKSLAKPGALIPMVRITKPWPPCDRVTTKQTQFRVIYNSITIHIERRVISFFSSLSLFLWIIEELFLQLRLRLSVAIKSKEPTWKHNHPKKISFSLSSFPSILHHFPPIYTTTLPFFLLHKSKHLPLLLLLLLHPSNRPSHLISWPILHRPSLPFLSSLFSLLCWLLYPVHLECTLARHSHVLGTREICPSVARTCPSRVGWMIWSDGWRWPRRSGCSWTTRPRCRGWGSPGTSGGRRRFMGCRMWGPGPGLVGSFQVLPASLRSYQQLLLSMPRSGKRSDG